ncbi:3058_t:CDS:2 [Acaulospora morrowiae]|uniref:3058_t:CDS:1 n=1 Tax=Acaulospora morrowiae TaxID=94023 RepID=A0A9N9CLA8_9GLOM|nr:3058_t:CDS:2 [Acaulospora morrowiae]
MSSTDVTVLIPGNGQQAELPRLFTQRRGGIRSDPTNCEKPDTVWKNNFDVEKKTRKTRNATVNFDNIRESSVSMDIDSLSNRAFLIADEEDDFL